MLETEFGIDFTHYKPSTVTRRIERRLQLAKVDDVQQYVARLQSERAELDVLYRDLLIGVTRFFRNEAGVRDPRRSACSRSCSSSARRDARCASGSPAVRPARRRTRSRSCCTSSPRSRPDRSFQIFATDVHRGSIELAGRAFYPESALVNVSPERRDRYFIRSGASYQLVPELRQAIVFAPHNVIKDAPFTRVDLVSCRNMLIYFQPPVQQKVLNQFHFALNRGGVMFLGPSESPGALLKDFETIDQHWRIYRKHSDVRTPVDPRLRPRLPESGPRREPTNSPFARYSMSNLLATYDVLLEDFMPPSLLVNDRNELVHAFGGASRFLKPRDGRQGLEVIDQVDDDLKLVLRGWAAPRAAVADADRVQERAASRSDGVDAVHDVSLRRVAPRNTEVAHILISFDAARRAAHRVAAETDDRPRQLSRDQLGALEAELDYTKENLQAAIEQLETGNEELQASNEELMSSNEELQSTNEELQSVNEELYTVNAEYQSKIAQLTELTNDMDNLLASTDIGTIFLDEDLRIRKFTPQVAESFKLMPHDVGRSIETFTNNMEHPELDRRRAAASLATGERIEREVRDQHGRSFFLRILPYRAKGGTSGAVITFIDDQRPQGGRGRAVPRALPAQQPAARACPDAIYFRDTRGKFIRANPAFATRAGPRGSATARSARRRSRCPTRRLRSSSIARTRRSCGPARRSTTSSSGARAPTARPRGIS